MTWPSVTIEEIEAFARQIGRVFNPERVILFGSYAQGCPTRDSDADILVILRHEGKNWRMASQIRERLHPRFPLDLVVRTPEQVRERLALGDCFMKEITTKGKVLYESADRGMGQES